MGLDLTLVIIREDADNWWLGYDRIDLDRQYGLFDQLKHGNVSPKQFPAGVRFDWYGDEGLKRISEDPYGVPLTYALAREFAGINNLEKLTPWNLAVVKFVQALPPNTRIVLHWW